MREVEVAIGYVGGQWEPLWVSIEDSGNALSDISWLSTVDAIAHLDVSENDIETIDVIASLSNLSYLSIGYNSITDLGPLAANTGIGDGDRVDLRGLPLACDDAAYRELQMTLLERGVFVESDCVETYF